jgi:hypothetical protein
MLNVVYQTESYITSQRKPKITQFVKNNIVRNDINIIT